MSKVVLVTGASSGIGQAIARHLAAVGDTVYGVSRNTTEGPVSKNLTMLRMDVCNELQVKQVVERIIGLHGRIDAVVNNAGTGFNGPVEDVSNEEVRANFELNTLGTWNVCRAVMPYMRTARSGHIINITSVAGRQGLPFRGVYAATKHATEAMSESLSMEVRHWGIQVVIVEPAEFNTPIVENRGSAAQVSDFYKADFKRVVEQVNRGVRKAPTPQVMGERIHAIIHNPHPALRYAVANRTARLSLFLKKILPGRWFERLVMKHYGLR